MKKKKKVMYNYHADGTAHICLLNKKLQSGGGLLSLLWRLKLEKQLAVQNKQ